jgi:glycosyltransferase involved in cell wall biosynthesis
VYAGSVGTVYLLGEMLDFYLYARERFSEARLLLLTPGDQRRVAKELGGRRLQAPWVTHRAADHSEIPGCLARARVGLAFYRNGYSRMATCPTKVGEYLACGLPVVVNEGVGDLDDIVPSAGVGVVVRSLTERAYRRALDELDALLADPQLSARCRRVATEHFSLAQGAEKYGKIYERLVR